MAVVAIQKVTRPTHLNYWTFRNRTGTDRVRIDVYAGWVGVNFAVTGQNTVQRTFFDTFLLVDSSTILEYAAEQELLDVAVHASLSSVADEDDEANVAAVDDASVSLRTQAFPGVAGSPLVLIMRLRVAALNATVHGVGYKVTVKSAPREDLKTIPKLDPDTAPSA